MTERYLTYNPGRRRVWTEHNCFPAKAIKLWREDGDKGYPTLRSLYVFKVYRIHEGGDVVTLVPESEWDEYAS